MSEHHRLETVMDSQENLEKILEQWVKEKQDLSLVSILRIEPLPEGGSGSKYTLGTRLHAWNQIREAWTARLGRATHSGLFGLGGVGTLVVVGPATTVMARVLESPQQGLSTMGQAMQALGVPEPSMEGMESALQAGQLLLLVGGADQQPVGPRGAPALA